MKQILSYTQDGIPKTLSFSYRILTAEDGNEYDFEALVNGHNVNVLLVDNAFGKHRMFDILGNFDALKELALGFIIADKNPEESKIIDTDFRERIRTFTNSKITGQAVHFWQMLEYDKKPTIGTFKNFLKGDPMKLKHLRKLDFLYKSIHADYYLQPTEIFI
jgi:hypothetical protein